MSIVSSVAEFIATDDTDESIRIRAAYLAAPVDARAIVDDIFISMCGYGLNTLIEQEGAPLECGNCEREFLRSQVDGETCPDCGGELAEAKT